MVDTVTMPSKALKKLQAKLKQLQAENKRLKEVMEEALQQNSLVELAEYQALKETQ